MRNDVAFGTMEKFLHREPAVALSESSFNLTDVDIGQRRVTAVVRDIYLT